MPPGMGAIRAARFVAGKSLAYKYEKSGKKHDRNECPLNK
jgi:hypothetical protein